MQHTSRPLSFATPPPPRWPLLLVLLTSVLSLGAALYLQESKGWYPCALCIAQRYAYMGAGVLALLGVFSAGVSRKLWVSLAMLSAVLGLGVAAYHVWVLAHPGVSCGVDPLQVKLNALPWVQYWPVMFEADGLCTAEYPPFFGLDLPAWSALGFVFELLLVLVALKPRRG